MAKNKKPLLNEGTIRRMMKLADMDALGDGFINEKWGSKADEFKREEEGGVEKKAGDEEHHYKAYEKNENLNEEGEDELEAELGATEGELGAEDSLADEEGVEIDALEAEGGEGEVVITDEEAQDIIDLADKLRDAVGGEEEVAEVPEIPEEEVELEGEEEIGIEEPGNRSMYEEELYEAALKGMDLEIVDDKAQKMKQKLEEIQTQVYKRVIKRLLTPNKK